MEDHRHPASTELSDDDADLLRAVLELLGVADTPTLEQFRAACRLVESAARILEASRRNTQLRTGPLN